MKCPFGKSCGYRFCPWSWFLPVHNQEVVSLLILQPVNSLCNQMCDAIFVSCVLYCFNNTLNVVNSFLIVLNKETTVCVFLLTVNVNILCIILN